MDEFEKNNENSKQAKGKKEIPVREIGELLDEVAGKLPKLLDAIQRTYYSQENGANTGRSVGAFYKELISAGVPGDLALQLTQNYMITLKDIVNINNNERG